MLKFAKITVQNFWGVVSTASDHGNGPKVKSRTGIKESLFPGSPSNIQ